jgi:TonB family protein
MFASLSRIARDRRLLSRIGSAAVHALLLWIICLRPAPIFVKPVQIAHGDRGPTTILYFAEQGSLQVRVAQRSKHVSARLYLPVQKETKFNAKVTDDRNVQPQNSDPVSASRAGSPTSSDLYGSTTGADVRPAIETTLIDPPVSKTEIPPGIEGDVIIEITIDEQGSVTDTKLLKSFGYGIDEKILATVRNWHYRPATRDGVPIPSKYDARWHFRG